MKNAMRGDAFPRNAVVSACCAPSRICVLITPSDFYLKSPILRVSSTLNGQVTDLDLIFIFSFFDLRGV